MENQTFWGVDLGGTKIEGVVLDANFEILARLRIPTEQENGYTHIIKQIGKLVKLLKILFQFQHQNMLAQKHLCKAV